MKGPNNSSKHQTIFSACMVVLLQVWLFLDQLCYNYFNRLLQSTYDPTSFLIYKWISLLILGLALAFFAAKCSAMVPLLAGLFVLNLVVCAVNIPFLNFINRKEPFLLFMGILLFKIAEKVKGRIQN